MNYYPFHIGDYATHTAHLEPMEDLAYRRLLDLYYLREASLPVDPAECARLIRLRNEVELVTAMLNEFFVASPEGWVSDRCDRELVRMLDKQAKAQASAQASVAARRARAEQSLNDRSTTVELPTPTPIPTPIEKQRGETPDKPARFDPLAIELPTCIPAEAWGRWIAYRRKRKLSTTEQTALAQVRKLAEWEGKGHSAELVIDQSIANGWQGLFETKNEQRKPRMNAIGVDAETPEGFQDGFH